MDRQHPVFTIQTECHDCYKCVRQCPVKAIRVEDGHAAIIPELCIACGHCLKVCPSRAKRVRDDIGRARLLLSGTEPVYASIAPSWVSEFSGIRREILFSTLRRLGFAGVSETALGANLVSFQMVEEMKTMTGGALISSACPAAVEFIARYLPDFRDSLSKVPSPALVHCQMLQKIAGGGKVVFIGPCSAKKLEADRNPQIMSLALTFQDMRKWLEQDGIDLCEDFPGRSGSPDVSGESDESAEPGSGSLYPVPGGMIETLRMNDSSLPMFQITGLANLERYLAGIDPAKLINPVFLEVLACEGGCLEGPCMSDSRCGLMAALEVYRVAGVAESGELSGSLNAAHFSSGIKSAGSLPARYYSKNHEEPMIRRALARVGKTTPEDELNCGGCGYDTCRNFASALLEEKAEPAMCASWMRRRAARKANALLRCIPSGVVIVDSNLDIIECNKSFAGMFGRDIELVFEARPGMTGARICRILPLEELFRAALRTGQDISREHLPLGERLFHITIFTIDPAQTIGVIVRDVTETETRREQIACRAREVIQKNLQTVQEIACRLGEHMADTEILLSSIAEDYGPGRSSDDTGFGKEG
ncbi:MAG: [Fe-S]-binding protein [Candidatus Wallbacteria bacterium HGW-Wallbacteria-1]|jgi:iron only hydrogenase large subunit-like protein|uniref:[Fe-S]-binding protein n=1 Tax=Candidatus Wallbacteria bacterium HGW-Wallbacteria-1 TaxID=2013854 RepID=A0A2N1PNC8_9BACT|nr:MAG: [Fe-S]-binding protein [Candidatus Wallbacteria bacterium HGW-Wallbacteria-1]